MTLLLIEISKSPLPQIPAKEVESLIAIIPEVGGDEKEANFHQVTD
jgi:hypothetical protein